MRLETIDQLKKVKKGNTLFLINPYRNRSQARVEIQVFTVMQIDGLWVKGKTDLISGDFESYSRDHFHDWLDSNKYVYNQLSEAADKLKEVRNGLHKVEVKKHHDLCDKLFG